MQIRSASPRLNLARVVIVASYIASLLLPVAAEPPNAAGAVSWWHGYTVLALGGLAILDLQFAWLGNPLLVVALLRPSRTVSALLAGVVVFALGWHTIPTDANYETIRTFGAGYYLWIAAMVGAAALPWIDGRERQDGVAPSVAAGAAGGAAPTGTGTGTGTGAVAGSTARSNAARSSTRQNGWAVTATDTRIEATDGTGAMRGIALSDLGAIVIETNDQGPFASDVWWILFETNRQFACAFPQDAEGAKAAIDRLLDLPGIDHRKVIDAQTSIQNATFPIWARTAGEPATPGETGATA
ncbi:hypothetical protein KDX27_07065 [Burkholderia cenocepacia]|uniref:hypothetical protein n=1 Tax=Burkholderia cenocepacia TaxID=95486 RepID=UPI00196ACF4F|nr:hypothetical protein [Burkholderia cenocepacia]MBN3530265.1 hypothetical protein [Burkholderia cenocepacia]MBO1855875.1 hypothetical protein [Burkholderia cenocepacia]MBR8023653.1 hypothetical protein [Burkholderia cenocepacia]MBR8167467.1 hypothetical protein [Burkholderia cenocepacia]MBR8422150.1 hypothetical protein [Burkholderia cenocepacia]